MNSQERIITALNHEEEDRVPITDNLWTATIERWRREGLPAGVTPSEYFGYENIGFDSDTSPRFPVEVVSEDAQYVILRDFYGGLRRNHKGFSTTPEFLEHPVKTLDDWGRIKASVDSFKRALQRDSGRFRLEAVVVFLSCLLGKG